MKHILQVLLEGIVATLLMTAFDYLLAIFSGKRIKVVKILGTMLTGQVTAGKGLSDSRTAVTTGIIAHYAVGVLFSVVYHILWTNGIGTPTLVSGVWFGLASGVVAVAVWRSFFALHPNPPAIALVSFLSVIFAAHIIFATTMVVTHNALGPATKAL